MKTLALWYVHGGRIYPTREQAPAGATVALTLKEALAMAVRYDGARA